VTPARSALTLVLFGALAVALFSANSAGTPSTSSEERCFGVVEEMVRSGDWLVPRFEGAPRLQKPPLYYWAGAAVAELTGAPVLRALRWVSGVAALALAAAVFAVGASFSGFPTAFASAAALGATLLFHQRGRIGDAEMLLALVSFLALAAFESLWRTRDRRLLPVLAGLVGLAFLTKATAGLLNVFAPIVAWLALQRSLRLVLRPAVLGWALAALALSLSWYAAILWHVPGALDLFREYLVGPLGVHAGGRDATHLRSFFYYWPRFPLLTAATGLLLPWLLWEAWRTRFFAHDPRARFLALSLVSLIFSWSVVPSKQMHYLLPMAPLQALLVGKLAVERWRTFRQPN
jgi:4-amino-4-deoxy-L-arabinose transferase-like glycosyltransferase